MAVFLRECVYSIKHMLKKIVVALLTCEAKCVLRRHKPLVIAVSGSVGKTTTKDMIYRAIAGHAHVRKSEKSFNSEIGVPLTILGLPNAKKSLRGWIENLLSGVSVLLQRTYPSILVLEVGADHPGDLRRLHWLTPGAGVFTRYPDVPAHVEFFSSPEAVIEEKREMRRALREDGVLCINADDPKMQQEPLREKQRKVSYGYGEHADVRLGDYTFLYDERGVSGASFSVTYKDVSARVELRGVLGKHYTYSIGAALAVACGVFDIPLVKAVQRVVAQEEGGIYAPGRMRVFSGLRGSVLLDDTYNASPTAVEGLLATVRDITVTGKKIVVLGDMMELGEHTAREHRRAGEHVADVADVFVAVGVRMKEALYAAQQKGSCRTEWFPDAEHANTFLMQEVQHGDLVAVKGSRHAMRMERSVKALLEDEKDAQYLVC